MGFYYAANALGRFAGTLLAWRHRAPRNKAPLLRLVAQERDVEEGSMAFLSKWNLYSWLHRRELRSLASAFIGEIAAILRVIETHDIVSTIERAAGASDGAHSFPNLKLPPFTIYTADAGRLDKLPSPVPRRIAYFYAQIASFQNDLTALAAEGSAKGPRRGDLDQMQRMLCELKDTLALGDEILRDLRPLVSRARPLSLVRA